MLSVQLAPPSALLKITLSVAAHPLGRTAPA
jgi:hypothetical protein